MQQREKGGENINNDGVSSSQPFFFAFLCVRSKRSLNGSPRNQFLAPLSPFLRSPFLVTIQPHPIPSLPGTTQFLLRIAIELILSRITDTITVSLPRLHSNSCSLVLSISPYFIRSLSPGFALVNVLAFWSFHGHPIFFSFFSPEVYLIHPFCIYAMLFCLLTID